MSESVTGAALIAVPTLFNVGFTLLAQRFDYPDVTGPRSSVHL
jgi:hypothetical protein